MGEIPIDIRKTAYELARNSGWSYDEDFKRIADALLAERNRVIWQPTHRHKKRGSEYQIVAFAEIQTDTPLTDYAKVIVYCDRTGLTWVRPVSEFEDGRFEPIHSPSPKNNPTQVATEEGEP